MSEYIINSRLDTDVYQLYMGQFIFHRYPDVEVKYAFKNRTSGVNLPKYICEKELRKELDHLMEIKPEKEEIDYLASLKKSDGQSFFKGDYLKFFENLELPLYQLENTGDSYRLEFHGPWKTGIYWETPALAIMTELYTKGKLKEMDWTDQAAHFGAGKLKYAMKLAKLKEYSESLKNAKKCKLLFSDFGTRRRSERSWHELIVKITKELLPKEFLGTSNLWLAKKYDLKPIGTMAHQMFMVMCRVLYQHENPVLVSQNKILKEWWDEYGQDLSIALTDTFGTEFFLKNFSKEEAIKWKGLRQDSGDPCAFAEKTIEFYQNRGIDPKEKIIVFSDGLEAETIIAIHKKFSSRIKCVFGWGTNLTNDLMVKPLSLIIKPVEVNGRPTIKLSDNIAKATGDPEEIERVKKMINYKNAFNQECVY